MSYNIPVKTFVEHKKYLDGYVFYNYKDDFVIIKQVCPSKSIKTFLTQNQIK